MYASTSIVHVLCRRTDHVNKYKLFLIVNTTVLTDKHAILIDSCVSSVYDLQGVDSKRSRITVACGIRLTSVYKIIQVLLSYHF